MIIQSAETEISKYQNKCGDKKPFIIWMKVKCEHVSCIFGSEWQVWSRYKSKKARDAAFDVLQKGGLSFVADDASVFEYQIEYQKGTP